MNRTSIWLSTALAGATLVAGSAALAGEHEPGLQAAPGGIYQEKVPQAYVPPAREPAVAGEMREARNEYGAPEKEASSGEHGKSRAEIAAFELKTAAKHAGFAAKAKDAATARQHLQHAINCMVGKDDPAYDSSAEDPCKGKGEGAIADARQTPGGRKTEKTLSEAKEVALQGKQESEGEATAAAKRLESLLQKAEQEVSAEE